MSNSLRPFDATKLTYNPENHIEMYTNIQVIVRTKTKNADANLLQQILTHKDHLIPVRPLLIHAHSREN